jgi:predicted histidine transporter YuiF (NhaC family)
LIKHIADGAPDDGDILEDPVEDPSKRFSAVSDEMSVTSMILIAIGTIVGVAGILYCSFSKARETEESTNWARIREKNQDRERNYATLQAIA